MDENSVDCGQMGRIMSKPHAHLQTVTKQLQSFEKIGIILCACVGDGVR